ncbi:protein tyrosine phosphatase, non-receptor type 12, partial [Quaeritorhiza haematococci]
MRASPPGPSSSNLPNTHEFIAASSPPRNKGNFCNIAGNNIELLPRGTGNGQVNDLQQQQQPRPSAPTNKITEVVKRGSLASRRSAFSRNLSLRLNGGDGSSGPASASAIDVPLQPPKLDTTNLYIPVFLPESPRSAGSKPGAALPQQAQASNLEMALIPRWLYRLCQLGQNAPTVLHRYFLQIEEKEGERLRAGAQAGEGHPHYIHISQVRGNARRNRYSDILPFDHNRVRLGHLSPNDGSDYINASYIQAPEGVRSYIVTQGPLPHTAGDFWQMVWEQNSAVVVMLTQEEERGRLKCHRYWPDAVGRGKFFPNAGGLEVRLDSEETLTGGEIVLRVMRISRGDKSRRIWQVHYVGWPDHRVSNPRSVLTVIDLANTLQQRADMEYRGLLGTPEPAPIDEVSAMQQQSQNLAAGTKRRWSKRISATLGFSSSSSSSSTTTSSSSSTTAPVPIPSATSSSASNILSASPTPSSSPPPVFGLSRSPTNNITNTTASSSPASQPSTQGAGPPVIHCSAGCGRTGTYCAIDTTLSLLSDLGLGGPAHPDLILSTVHHLRSQRVSMVQTLEQFAFVYEAVLYRIAEWQREGRPPKWEVVELEEGDLEGLPPTSEGGSAHRFSWPVPPPPAQGANGATSGSNQQAGQAGQVQAGTASGSGTVPAGGDEAESMNGVIATNSDASSSSAVPRCRPVAENTVSSSIQQKGSKHVQALQGVFSPTWQSQPIAYSPATASSGAGNVAGGVGSSSTSTSGAGLNISSTVAGAGPKKKRTGPRLASTAALDDAPPMTPTAGGKFEWPPIPSVPSTAEHQNSQTMKDQQTQSQGQNVHAAHPS